MSQQYDNEKRFALFENDKGDNPKRPDFRGTLQLDGQPYKLSGWMRTSQSGKQFISGAIEPDTKEQPTTSTAPSGFGTFGQSADRSAPPQNRPGDQPPLDEDVPF